MPYESSEPVALLGDYLFSPRASVLFLSQHGAPSPSQTPLSLLLNGRLRHFETRRISFSLAEAPTPASKVLHTLLLRSRVVPFSWGNDVMSALNHCEAPTRPEKRNRVVRPLSKCLMPRARARGLWKKRKKKSSERGTQAGTVLDSARPVLLLTSS